MSVVFLGLTESDGDLILIVRVVVLIDETTAHWGEEGVVGDRVVDLLEEVLRHGILRLRTNKVSTFYKGFEVCLVLH